MTTTDASSRGPATSALIEAHRETLQLAREALASRGYFSRYPEFIHTYNHHRGHTALGGKSPADRVPNLRGQYT